MRIDIVLDRGHMKVTVVSLINNADFALLQSNIKKQIKLESL